MKPTPETAPSNGPLVILGASVRSLAESARRAGFQVHAADLFRDLDLVAAAREAVRVRGESGGYPHGLATAAAGFPQGAPWCYTGALENHPELLAALAARRPLAGTPAERVVRIRDPDLLAAAVAAAGLRVPDTHHRPDGLPTDGSYLVKPRAGAGGRGIRPWDGATAAEWSRRPMASDQARHVWQRRLAGTPVSASYVMAAGTARLVGVTRQLVGADWCHAPRFAWCGGVIEDRPAWNEGFERLGATLAAAFEPVGMIGVDAVVDTRGRIGVLEVNPRPTASMELFERACGISIAARHLTACGHVAIPEQPPPAEPGWHWAKAVLFAAGDAAVSTTFVESLRRIAAPWARDDADWPAIADVPAAGQVLAAGSPACTLFARGRRADDALRALRGRVAPVADLLAASRPCGAA
jgi:predicted ATP-grasp superfamily ATP-dependent carboligase